jgi:hypothetical protein
MQTTGAALVAVEQRSIVRLWTPGQDGPSALGLLYLTAVLDDWYHFGHYCRVAEVSQAIGRLIRMPL